MGTHFTIRSITSTSFGRMLPQQAQTLISEEDFVLKIVVELSYVSRYLGSMLAFLLDWRKVGPYWIIIGKLSW